MPRIFTEEQIKYIKTNLSVLHSREIAKRMGLKESQVRYIAGKYLGYSFRKEGRLSRTWADWELQILANPNKTDYEKTKLLPHRTDASVRIKRKRMEYHSKKVVFNRQFESEGYVFVRCRNGYNRRCRETAEKMLGRSLTKKEVVHHINGIKNNDRAENLFVCDSRAEHSSIHAQGFGVLGQILETGVVKFDRETRRYELCQDLRNYS